MKQLHIQRMFRRWSSSVWKAGQQTFCFLVRWNYFSWIKVLFFCLSLLSSNSVSLECGATVGITSDKHICPPGWLLCPWVLDFHFICTLNVIWNLMPCAVFQGSMEKTAWIFSWNKSWNLLIVILHIAGLTEIKKKLLLFFFFLPLGSKIISRRWEFLFLIMYFYFVYV